MRHFNFLFSWHIDAVASQADFMHIFPCLLLFADLDYHPLSHIQMSQMYTLILILRRLWVISLMLLILFRG